MPQKLATEREQRIVEEAARQPEGVSVRVVLLIDGEDYSGRMEGPEWGQTDIAISLATDLAGVLPRRLEDAEVRLYAEVEEVLVPQMVGVKTAPEVGEGNASTELLSASAGALLATTEVREVLRFPGAPPESVVRATFRRISEYPRGSVRVDPLGTPTFNLVGDRAIQPEDACLDILSVINDGTQLYTFRDTQTGGHAAEAFRGFGGADEVTRTYDARDMVNWRRPSRKPEQYAYVEVFRFKPNGDDAYRKRARVPYVGLNREPPAGNVLTIYSGDDGPEAEDRALKTARTEAQNYARGLYGGEVGLPAFDPLVQKGDLSRVEAEERDDDGLWDRAYLLRVESYKHPQGASLETYVAYTAAILEEDLIKPPAFVMPGFTGAAVVELFTARRESPGAGLRAKVGVSPAVRVDGRGRWLTPSKSDGQIRVEANGVWIEVS